MTHTPPQHGERRCYLRGCRRPECVMANKRYCKQYRVATVREPIRVDAAPSAARLQSWTDQGYSHAQITAVTNVNSGEISRIARGDQQRIHPTVARRILTAPEPAGAPCHAVTDATGTIRRGRALHVMGHPLYRIAEALPMATNHLSRILNAEPATVRVSIASSMCALYKEWCARPGTSVYAPAAARRKGWHGPAAWDDIDDPAEQPDTGDESTLTRDQLAALRREEIAHLASFNLPEHEIADRLGMGRTYVHDLIRDMRRAA